MSRTLSRCAIAVVVFAFFGRVAQAQWQPTTSTADSDPITHSGNVAIGTTTTDPYAKLRVVGWVYSDGSSYTNSGFRLKNTSAVSTTVLAQDGSNNLMIGDILNNLNDVNFYQAEERA